LKWLSFSGHLIEVGHFDGLLMRSVDLFVVRMVLFDGCVLLLDVEHAVAAGVVKGSRV